MNCRHMAGMMAVGAALTLSATAKAAVDVRQYALDLGSKYTYYPSSFGPGIPGGVPSDYELEFGVGGLFSVEYDQMAGTAKFVDLDLALTGNEAVQNNPPLFGIVTADRLETWLAGRLFDSVPVGAPINLFVDQQFDGFSLTDFLMGTVTLTGGYDAQLVDGDGIEFAWSATVVPEPATGLLGVAAIAAGVVAVRGRRGIRT